MLAQRIYKLLIYSNLFLSCRSFRLKNKRPLKRLMMVNEGGCPYNLPGIGDISYVKNLITEEITSKNYHCSVFGVYSHPSARIGWVREK